MSILRTSILLDLAGNLGSRAPQYGRALGDMASRGQRSLGMLRSSAASLGRGLDSLGNRYTAMLAGAGAAYKAAKAIKDSAALDKQLTRIRQTAGATTEQAEALRIELHTMAQQTGQSLEDLLAGFNNLIQSGLSWDAAFSTIQAINRAMAVTGASADVLSAGMTVAAEAFDFDLTNLETSTSLLDKMTVAGRLGNAELEDLSGIFARVGVNAKSAGLSFDETLGFIERLSLIERNPERLATLADSTLRLFTNQNYLQKAAKASGVKFYDAQGERRAAFDVLKDIAAKYNAITTRQRKDSFIDAAFGDADLDTRKGLATLLGGNAIAEARDMSTSIASSFGVIAADLPDAINNAMDQTERLKAALRDAADGFARPINQAVQESIKSLLDSRKLGGRELLLGGLAAGAVSFGAVKLGGRMLSRVGGSLARAATGGLGGLPVPLPVYVVNSRMSLMPGQYGGGFAGGAAGGAGAGGTARGGWLGRGANLLRRAGASRWGRVAGWGGAAVAGLASAPGLIDAWTDDQVSTRQAWGRTARAGLSLGGSALGATIGSFLLPGIGTMLGGMAGGWLGDLAGGLAEKFIAEPSAREQAGQDQKARLEIAVTDERVKVKQVEATGYGDVDVDLGMSTVGY